jgi:hypothetical protein
MEFWEFLLQKDGDHSWLPLESTNVEILEGRYRVMARSSRVNTPLEIRVTHDALEENPPRRRIQKRLSQTNEQGLVVIIPYTRLKPGVWELRCHGDLMSDLMGEGWQHMVKLQVNSHEATLAQDWDADWQDQVGESELADASESTSVNGSDANRDRTRGWVHPSSEVGDESIASITSGDIDVDQLATDPRAAVVPAYNWLLTLQQDTFCISWGESVTITGQIEAVAKSPEDEKTDELSGFLGELQISLLDPQYAQVIWEGSYPLTIQTLPLGFNCSIAIPQTHQTQLILGEVQFVEVNPSCRNYRLLTRCSFTVTSDVEDLLGAIALSLDTDENIQPPLIFLNSSPHRDLNLALLDLVSAPSTPLQFQPAANSILPPQLYQPDPAKPRLAAVELPFFQSVTSLQEQSQLSQPTAVSVEESSPDEADGVATPALSVTSTGHEADVIESAWDWEAIDFSEAALRAGQIVKYEPDESPQANSPEDEEFQALNLQRRFWSRLTAIATDRELLTWLDRIDPVNSRSFTDSPIDLDANLAAQEIVVEDEPAFTSRLASASRPTQLELKTTTTVESPSISVLSKDEPIPMPRLKLPNGELVSGNVVTIIACLPLMPSRLYVKVWLRDRQSRTVLDGPQWIINFFPSHHCEKAEMEGRAQVQIPFGCLEIEVEAIAIEMATQRESHKVTLERSIVPPNSPTSLFSLNPFD